jgi:hypothetical protein
MMETLSGGMKMRFVVYAKMLALLVAVMVSGCATPAGHHTAFSDQTGLIGNSKVLDVSASQAAKAARQVLIRQGFTIDSVDLNAGLIKATRNFQDPEKPEQSYNINASVFILENTPESCTVVASASQQTILHREWKTWWHLLWIIPIFPTGTEYQTVVTQEGNVTNPTVYADFFTKLAAVGAEIKVAEKAAATKAAAEKAAAEKAAAEKAAAEKAATENIAQ